MSEEGWGQPVAKDRWWERFAATGSLRHDVVDLALADVALQDAPGRGGRPGGLAGGRVDLVCQAGEEGAAVEDGLGLVARVEALVEDAAQGGGGAGPPSIALVVSVGVPVR